MIPQSRKAILSVSNKDGVAELAEALVRAGVELFSTGGTSRHLKAAGLDVTDVSDLTGFPEIMDGRVKTLHPAVFGGILCRRDNEQDQRSATALKIPLFDFVVVNLYPFRQTVARGDASLDEAIENIDVGGPSMIRAAAKNHRWVTVLTDPAQYAAVLAELQSEGGTTESTRRRLMIEAFSHTAAYDAAIQAWFSQKMSDDLAEADRIFPPAWTTTLERIETLRYGENSHQLAALYRNASRGSGAASSRQLNGKQLSYNNRLDLDAALGIVIRLDQPGVAVLKHNNPCGAAVAESLQLATARAFAGDPVSAFGSVVGMNRVVDAATAQWLGETAGLFVEAIIAPGFEPAALKILQTLPKWKNNVRLLATGDFVPPVSTLEIRTIAGGALVQHSDNLPDNPDGWTVATECRPDDALRADLKFGWALVRSVKSNAITLSRECALVGVGAGQMSRVDSVRIANEKAGERARGAVLASDAFFPFPDSIELAAAAGISAIVQPGGSVRDADVIAAANRHRIPMLFTGRRHFRH